MWGEYSLATYSPRHILVKLKNPSFYLSKKIGAKAQFISIPLPLTKVRGNG